MCTQHENSCGHDHDHDHDDVPAHQMLCKSEMAEMLSSLPAAMPAGFEVKELMLTPYPLFSAIDRSVTFAVALLAVVKRNDGLNSLTMLQYHRDASDEEVFSWFCFDKLFRGELDTREQDDRWSQCLQKIHVSMRKQASATFTHALNRVATFKIDNCGYWANANKAKPNVYTCDDTAALLSKFREQNPIQRPDEALRGYYNLLVGVTASAGSASAREEVTFRNYTFSQPILFVGESGSGKTRQAYEFAKSNNSTLVKLSCEAGTTGVDILGFYMKAPDGNMLWVDGAMTEAFRKAASGTRTVLLIDELLRPDIREISIFLTALDPDPFTGEYVLRTGRILSSVDGVAVTETLRVSPENLCVIATTNMGGKYNVGEMDKALSDRFVMFRIDTTMEGVKEATQSACRASSLPLVLADNCAKFWKAMSEAKVQNLVSETPTKRILIRAINHSSSPSQLPLHLKAMAAHWVSLNSDGFPNPQQLATVNKLIETAFK